MIDRYAREEMKRIWSRENKFQKWLEIEMAAAEAQTELGIIPQKSFDEIKEKAGFSIEEIDDEEEKTRHEIVAFLNSVFKRVGESSSRYIHYGMTSSDIMDTGVNLQLKEANELLEPKLLEIIEILKRLVNKYKYTPIIGRSHGIHAEPTTFGLKLAIFYDEFKRGLRRFRDAVKDVNIGMVSGPVGNYSQLDPAVEEHICKKFNLNQPGITNQIIQRDRYAYYISALAILAGTIEKLAVELRNLARTEIGEVEEPFLISQKGSSAMPHKRNPVALEQLTGLCRMVRSYATPSMENIVLWHERDISHSSVERVILPDSTILMDYIFNKLAYILDNMNVDEDRMRENIEFTKGLVFSQRLMLRMVNAGMSRERAHTMVQGKIMASWKEGKDFYDQIRRDGEIRRYITIEEIEALFDLDRYLKQVDYILSRVFEDDEDK
ncbi:MAG: adenylosuccinate lyase [Candidatus Zixiibacteriota bacterium]